SLIHGKSRRCWLGHVISCVQSQLITSVPPVSVHQCQLSVPISATYQCLPVHINATYQCPSELPFIVTHQSSQCHLSVPISATYHCFQSVPPISANQCHLSVPVSAAYPCQSVPPISAHH
ncbi:unnamed protein product, partial [Staurois parvus]